METIKKALNLQNFLPFIIFCIFLFKRFVQSPPGTNLPPSPRGLPVIGNLNQLTARAHRGLHALSLRRGDTMMLKLGVKRVLVVSSARSASLVMKTHDVAFASRSSLGVFRRVLYDGRDIAAAPYGEYWRQIRNVSVLQLLSNSRVRTYSEVREEEVSSMVGKIEGSVGKEVDLSEALMGLTNNIVCRVAFGKKSELQRLLEEFVELLGGFFVGEFIPWLGWINKVSGLDQRVERIKGELDEFLEGMCCWRFRRMKLPGFGWIKTPSKPSSWSIIVHRGYLLMREPDLIGKESEEKESPRCDFSI